MEGISSEAASLAAHLKLSNLCWIYDSNRITIEGGTPLAFSEDVGARFAAYGWNVTHVTDANDLDMIRNGFRTFLQTADRPTLIVVNSHIGWGSPHKQDSHTAHGEALGEEEVRLTKRNYGWPEDAKFLVPGGVYEHFQAGIGKRGKELRDAWSARFGAYGTKYPALADEISRMERRQLPDGWDKDLPVFPADAKGLATRDSSGKVENAIAKNVPWLLGGAADLAPSTKTLLTFSGATDFEAGNYAGRNMHFGIREHAMAAVINGMSLTKVRPYGATFFVFTDYMRGGMRLSAVMGIPVIYILTHDSIGVGEDGPTHQPIEHLAMLRATPGLIILRPADANEVVEAWKVVMHLQQPFRRLTGRNLRPRQAWLVALTSSPTLPAVNLTCSCSRPAAKSIFAWMRSNSFRKKESRRALSACRRGSCSKGRIRRIASRFCRPQLKRAFPSRWPRHSAGRATWAPRAIASGCTASEPPLR
jgi:transketolase